MPYRFVSGIVSDVGFEATGRTLKEMFESSAEAVFSVMYDVSGISAKKRFDVRVEGEDDEELLYNFLSEIAVAVETENMFFSRADVDISGKKLSATFWGEPATREKLKCIVKGIPLHNFGISRQGKGYKATVTVDI